LAAGAGAGGVLAVMLFLRGPHGRPRYSVHEALAFVAASIGRKCWGGQRGRWAKLLRGERTLRRVFNDAMLRDIMASLLVPCYDLATAAPSDAAPARRHGAHISVPTLPPTYCAGLAHEIA